MAVDPICHMEVDESTALKANRDGHTYFFCSDHCRTEFLQGSVSRPHKREHHEQPRLRADSTSNYVCPMCEGVESDMPGICPKCGMALEPTKPEAPKDPKIG